MANVVCYWSLQVKMAVVLTDFNQIWVCSTDLNKTPKPNFIKIGPVGSRVDTCGWMEGEKRGENG